jgi:hypothetical protein
MGRLVGCLLVVLVAGCGGATPVTTHFAAAQFSFDYPAAWHSAAPGVQGRAIRPVVYLSTGTAYNPCVTTTSGQSCGIPDKQLEPDGVAVTWSANGVMGWGRASQPGASATIAGRPAKVNVQQSGACADMGGDLSVTAVIALAAESNWVEMDACLRGPDLTAAQADVARMLDSLRLPQ